MIFFSLSLLDVEGYETCLEHLHKIQLLILWSLTTIHDLCISDASHCWILCSQSISARIDGTKYHNSHCTVSVLLLRNTFWGAADRDRDVGTPLVLVTGMVVQQGSRVVTDMMVKLAIPGIWAKWYQVRDDQKYVTPWYNNQFSHQGASSFEVRVSDHVHCHVEDVHHHKFMMPYIFGLSSGELENYESIQLSTQLISG